MFNYNSEQNMNTFQLALEYLLQNIIDYLVSVNVVIVAAVSRSSFLAFNKFIPWCNMYIKMVISAVLVVLTRSIPRRRLWSKWVLINAISCGIYDN